MKCEVRSTKYEVRETPIRPAASRSGFTLMELMVVIVIVVILTSSMIPIMSSASDARRCREGARLVSTMLSSAQTRAISTGRSAGVLFQPMKNNPYACMEMYLVEVPPPYSGDDFSYTAQIDSTGKLVRIVGPFNSSKNTFTPPTFAGISMADTQDSPGTTNQNLIRPGDLIRFNYRGQTYILNYGDSTQYTPYALSHDSVTSHKPNWWCVMTLTPTDPTGSYPPPNATNLPFQIFRQPIKTSDPPAQLSDGAAVDWYFSGIDLASPQPPPGPAPAPTAYPHMATMFGACGTVSNSSGAPGPAGMAIVPAPSQGTTCGPVIITFAPTGTIEQVYYSCYFATKAGDLMAANYTGNPSSPGDMDIPYFLQTRPLSGAYFLVGKIEKISQLKAGPIQNDPTNLPNYQDSNARWVSITRQSGLVTTTEVAKLQPQYANFPTSGTPTAYVTTSGIYPQSVPDWSGVLNAVMNSRRYASGNQSSGGI